MLGLRVQLVDEQRQLSAPLFLLLGATNGAMVMSPFSLVQDVPSSFAWRRPRGRWMNGWLSFRAIVCMLSGNMIVSSTGFSTIAISSSFPTFVPD
jgi:hypothetical protein